MIAISSRSPRAYPTRRRLLSTSSCRPIQPASRRFATSRCLHSIAARLPAPPLRSCRVQPSGDGGLVPASRSAVAVAADGRTTIGTRTFQPGGDASGWVRQRGDRRVTPILASGMRSGIDLHAESTDHRDSWALRCPSLPPQGYHHEELSDLLSVSPKTLYAMASKGRIPVIRIGSSLRFDPKLTADWIEARSIA